MLLLRLAAILVVITIAAGVVTYLATGNRKYLQQAFRIFKCALLVTLVFLGLMALERLIVIV